MFRILVIGLIMMSTSAGAFAQTPDFAGKFVGDGATIELRAAPFGYEGVMRRGAKAMPMQGKPAGNRLMGTFVQGGGHTVFSATLEGDQLRVSFGGTTLALMRRRGADAPAGAAGAIATAPQRDAGTPPPLPNQQRAASGAMRFRRVSVEDRQIILGEAVSFLVPVDWRVEGGIVWRPHPGLPAGAQLRAFDPASRQQVEAFPSFPFTWGDNCGPGCLMPVGASWFGNEVHPPFRSTAECLETTIIPRVRGALRWRVTQRENLPQLAAAQQKNTPVDPGARVFFDAARVRIEYDLGGAPIEEDFFAVVQTVQVPVGNIVIHIVDRVVAMRADRGQLDAARPLHLAIVNSSRINLQWFNRYAQIVAFLVRAKMQEIRAVGEFSRALAQTSSQITAERQQQWEETNRRQDRIDREWSECIRGTETFDDPVRGEPVELPSTHNHAWVSRGGEYVLTDNPNFNPNVELSGDWVEMRPTQ
jgi:hypothetical protein